MISLLKHLIICLKSFYLDIGNLNLILYYLQLSELWQSKKSHFTQGELCQSHLKFVLENEIVILRA